jgi:EmrB/QacA subfamily drug resistance transporter
MTTQSTRAGTETTDRARWLALYVLCTGMLMIVLDVTIVNVALPAIQADLHFAPSGLAWIVNAYLIAFGGLLLLSGRLGDLAGRRRVFLLGLGVFTAASAVCGASTSQPMLIAARFVQGAGGALTSAVVLGMIVTMFPQPREQAKAIGIFAFVASAGGAIGLLLGGVITQAVSWHWIFLVNVPIGAATAVLAVRFVEDDRGMGFREGADVLGAVLVTAALMLGVFTIVKPAAEVGWTGARTLLLGGISVGLLAAFVLRQALARNPLMPLPIFASRNLVGANLIQVVGAAGMFGTFFLGALYLQHVRQYDALGIGLAFLPVTVIMGTFSARYSERLITRFGARQVCLPGLVLLAAGLALFALAPADASYWTQLLPVMVLLGTGAGLCFPAMMGLAMSGVAPHEAGLASGLVNTTGQVGGALGLAVLATLSSTRTAQLLQSGRPAAEALTGGYHLAFWIATVLVVVAVGIGLLVLQNPAPAAELAEAGAESADAGGVAAEADELVYQAA